MVTYGKRGARAGRRTRRQVGGCRPGGKTVTTWQRRGGQATGAECDAPATRRSQPVAGAGRRVALREQQEAGGSGQPWPRGCGTGPARRREPGEELLPR